MQRADRATEAYIAMSGDIYEAAKQQDPDVTLALIQWTISRVLAHPLLFEASAVDDKAVQKIKTAILESWIEGQQWPNREAWAEHHAKIAVQALL